MSGNLLSKNHPFRASVTHGTAEIAPLNSNNPAPASEEDAKPKFSLSPKTKLICLLIVGLITTYGWIQIYDSMYPPKETPASNSKKLTKTNNKISYDEVTDFEWGYSDTESENYASETSKPNWFKQTFCKGVKRSFFCR